MSSPAKVAARGSTARSVAPAAWGSGPAATSVTAWPAAEA